MLPSAVSSSVDLPTPGSPPTSTSEAGDEAAAEHPVELGHARADAGRLLDTHIGQPLQRPGDAVPAPAPSSRGPVSSSISVPNALHPGHFPSQRPVVVPHSEHTCWTITFAISPWYATRRTDRCPIRQ